MLTQENGQRNIYSDLLNQIVRADHPYRKVLEIVNFTSLCKSLHGCYSLDSGAYGYPIEVGFKCLLLQQWEDLSDREMERLLQENTAAKLFCGFTLTDATPDHSFFGRMRQRIGVERLAKLFNQVTEQLRNQKLVSDVFTFVDATAIISKLSLWKERDKAIEDALKTQKELQKELKQSELTKEEGPKLSNRNISKYACDKDAKIGCKGKKKFWFGYKRHHTVDMSSGIITNVKVTPANVPDQKVVGDILPPHGMLFADKAYDTNAIRDLLRDKNIHSGIIKKNNRKDKDRDKDRWLTSLRMPYEGIFNFADKITPYRGLQKVSFHQVLDALTQNLKRLLRIIENPAWQHLKLV